MTQAERDEKWHAELRAGTFDAKQSEPRLVRYWMERADRAEKAAQQKDSLADAIYAAMSLPYGPSRIAALEEIMDDE